MSATGTNHLVIMIASGIKTSLTFSLKNFFLKNFSRNIFVNKKFVITFRIV